MIICRRRNFLRLLGYLTVYGLGRPVHAFEKTCRASTRIDDLTARLARFSHHQESAAVVGLEYLRHVPREADVHLLVDLICLCSPIRRIELAETDPATMTQLLRLQQRRDFEQGLVVNVHGWILSVTEARLCALAALV
jgi:hypothetical protein